MLTLILAFIQPEHGVGSYVGWLISELAYTYASIVYRTLKNEKIL
jgi:hypothetical protein